MGRTEQMETDWQVGSWMEVNMWMNERLDGECVGEEMSV